MEITSGAGGDLFGARGGGGLRPLDDAFQPDLLRGTGNYAVPLDMPAGPGGIRPSLALRYSTGQGNGPFGVGWQLAGALAITRGTDGGVPRYDDTDAILLGGDRLVETAGGRWRPRSDTQGWEIRRDGDGWRIRTKDGRAFALGTTADARVADGPRIAAWHVSEETDAAGNRIAYTWRRHGGRLYLAEVAWSVLRVRFVYEERADADTFTRTGFPLTTALRCIRIERHSVRTDPSLTGVFELGYDDAAGSGLSLLASVGYRGVAADGTASGPAPQTFEYAPFALDPRIVPLVSDDGVLPLGAPDAALVDFDGDGLPDVLQTTAAGHRWWRNRGEGRFDAARSIAAAPTGVRLGMPGVTFADLDGDGSADLVRLGTRLQEVARNAGDGSWRATPRTAAPQVALAVSSSTSRFVDLDGDGVTDLLMTGPEGMTLFHGDGDGDGGFGDAEFVRRTSADAPDGLLGDAGIHVADFAGDGMRTIGEVRSGLVRYWPHLGRGRFAPVVEMATPPTFPSGYRERNLFLADLDGDGTTDLLYVDRDRMLLWLNRSGRAWSAPIVIPFAPAPDVATLELVDVLGTGTPAVVWRRPGAAAARLFDLGVGVKPHLLRAVDNGRGGRTEIDYATSSTLRRAGDGSDAWGTYLPFPLHVVTRLVDRDLVTGMAAETRFAYEHGRFDRAERSFQGFAAVEVTRVGDGATPTVVRRTTFHLGADPDPDAAPDESARVREHALAGTTTGFDLVELAADGTRRPVESARLAWEVHDEATVAGTVVSTSPRLASGVSTEHPPEGRDRVETTAYAYDRFGNVVRKERSLTFVGDAEPLRSVQEITYALDEAAWLVGLPARLITRTGDGRLVADERFSYDGADFIGLPDGGVTHGLVTRRRELALLGDGLPAGYEAHLGADWGFERVGDDWYRTVEAVARDAAGNVVAMTDPLGAGTTVTYDADLMFPVESVDPLGRITRTRFDARTAQAVEVTTPEGLVTRYDHDATGRVVAQFDTTAAGTSALTVFTRYDDWNPATPAVPGGTVVVRPAAAGMTPDALAVADLAHLDGAAVVFAFVDGHGQVLQRSTRLAAAAGGWVHAARSRRLPGGAPSAEYPNAVAATPAYAPAPVDGPAVRFAYDAGGRALRVEHPDGSRFRIAHDGERVRKWDAETADDALPAVERYDAQNSLIAVETPLGADTVTTSYAVDHAGRITAVTDAEGIVATTYRFAGPGPAIVVADVTAGTRTYWRDAAGRERRRADAAGLVLEYAYDAVGRQTSVVDASDAAHPRIVRESVYDSSRLAAQIEGTIRTEYAYDAVGRGSAATVVYPDGRRLTVSRERGLRGEVQATTYPDGRRVEHLHHPDGSPRGLVGVVDAIDYDVHGLPTGLDFGGGLIAEYAHSLELKRLTSVQLRHGADVLRRQQYDYDRNGLITAVGDRVAPAGGGAVQTSGRRYGYDRLLRLTEWRTVDGGGSETARAAYSYDRRGDLLTSDETGPTRFVASPTDPRAVGSVVRADGTSTIVRDGAGRAVDVGGARDIRYDVWDRIVRMTLPDGTTIAVDYDAGDRRVQQVVTRPGGAVETTRWIDGVYETGPQGTRTTYAIGGLVVAVRTVDTAGTDRLTRLLADQLGSVLCTVDAAGEVLTQQSYTPYGLPIVPGTESRYAGGLEADGGMVQLGARWYHPLLGRFVSPDWYVLENPEATRRIPQGLNVYSYAIGNPVMLRDPSGRFFGLDDLIVAGIGFVVGFVTGVIVGIAEGKSFGDTLLLGLEAGILGAAGAWLAYATVGVAAGALGLGTGFTSALTGSAAVMGGLNGIISGSAQIYDWKGGTGFLAFFADSTWGITGTSLGVVLHAVNLFYGDTKYNTDASRRHNRHVYEGGFTLNGFAFTQGNVISHLGSSSGDLIDHETLHITQNRIFGPIFTATYVGWLVVGAVVGFFIGLGMWAAGKQGLGDSIQDVAYWDNPWELWAYDVGGGRDKAGKLAF